MTPWTLLAEGKSWGRQGEEDSFGLWLFFQAVLALSVGDHTGS